MTSANLAKIVDSIGTGASLIALVGAPVAEVKLLKGNGTIGFVAGLVAYSMIFGGKEKLVNYINSKSNYNTN